VTRVELPVEGLSAAEEACAAWAGAGLPCSLRWLPRQETLPDLPGLLALARAKGWGVSLPAAPAEEGPSLRPWRAEVLATGAWEAARRDAAALGGSLAVHDFHLSRALMMEGPEPAGCEAGDALAFIDEDGAVYACRSLRVRLGSLEEGLEAVWSSPARKRLRADLASPAPACGGCPHLPRCRGGCRGLAFHAAGRFDAADPRCPEGSR
jgi:radical SAM protein with 4Fe4S-binding SPASM domain